MHGMCCLGVISVKQREYIEGREATENFEEGMKALFKATKEKIEPLKKRTPKAFSVRKTKRSDKD
jgi:hypothetical protein